MRGPFSFVHPDHGLRADWEGWMETMKYDWMLDVLADLEAFALANDMQDLAAELADLKLIAAADIALKEANETEATRAARGRQNLH
ncbi:MAG: hypothetical protein JXQ85_10490 [Cognatishimia sp.]|uniref:hypothetical protein n=1 Tax=Cognatishimia sp. TaxID=2211648 RepID=UPI003B8DBD2F